MKTCNAMCHRVPERYEVTPPHSYETEGSGGTHRPNCHWKAISAWNMRGHALPPCTGRPRAQHLPRIAPHLPRLLRYLDRRCCLRWRILRLGILWSTSASKRQTVSLRPQTSEGLIKALHATSLCEIAQDRGTPPLVVWKCQ